MFAAAIIVIALMVMSQISKGSQNELQLAHAQEHNKDMDKAHAEVKEKELQKQFTKQKVMVVKKIMMAMT